VLGHQQEDSVDAARSRDSLGAIVRRRRQECGWSQDDLAARMVAAGDWTFRQSDVSRLELDKVALPRRARLTRLATVLELPLGDLLEHSSWAVTTHALVDHPDAAPTLARRVDAWSVAIPPSQATGDLGAPVPLAARDSAVPTDAVDWRRLLETSAALRAEARRVRETSIRRRAQAARACTAAILLCTRARRETGSPEP
jgi:transcriptional regulator with XRE-family HTH domain